MKRIALIIVTVLISFTSLHSQDQYYWYNGKKQYMDYYPNKKYIVVDSSITSKTELSRALNDTCLNINTFQESSVLIHLNVYDSTAYEKQYAILQSQDSIDEIALTNNPIVNYVGPYYIITSSGYTVGISRLFYVKLNQESDIALLDSMANSNNVTILGNDTFMPLWYTVECSEHSTGNALEMANLFYESNNFEHSAPDLMGSVAYLGNGQSCSDDYYFDQQWGLENTTNYDNIDIRACNVWEYTKGDSDIIISVLDSGVKLDHEDLSINAQISWDIETETSPSDIYWNEELNQLGSYNHGTNCAGIIGAQHNEIGVAGIAPDCEIMPISYNFYNYNNPEIRIARGINYAWQNGADIINCSWICSQHPFIDDAINNAITNGRNGKGTVVVAASGNYNNDTVVYPSILPDVISVGAVNECGSRAVGWHVDSLEVGLMYDCVNTTWPMNKGSQYGYGLSVVAPGHDIYTTNALDVNFVTDLYNGFDGTSAAAPHVAGIVALLLSINPDLTHEEVKNIIEYSAQKIRTDVYSYDVNKPNGMWNEKLGYGLVNAYFALQVLADDMCNVIPFISYSDYTIWDNQKYVCQDLEIHGTLVIDGAVNFLYNNPQIVISGSGKLIIEEDCILNTWRPDRPFDGSIYVEPGDSWK